MDLSGILLGLWEGQSPWPRLSWPTWARGTARARCPHAEVPGGQWAQSPRAQLVLGRVGSTGESRVCGCSWTHQGRQWLNTTCCITFSEWTIWRSEGVIFSHAFLETERRTLWGWGRPRQWFLGTFSSWTARAFHQEGFLFLPPWSPHSVVFYPGWCFAVPLFCASVGQEWTQRPQRWIRLWSWFWADPRAAVTISTFFSRDIFLCGPLHPIPPVYTAFHMKGYLFVLCLPVNWIVLPPPPYSCKGPSPRYTLDFPVWYSSSLKYNQLLPFLPKFSTRVHFSKLSFHNFLGLSFPIFKTEGVGLDEFYIWHASLPITFECCYKKIAHKAPNMWVLKKSLSLQNRDPLQGLRCSKQSKGWILAFPYIFGQLPLHSE